MQGHKPCRELHGRDALELPSLVRRSSARPLTRHRRRISRAAGRWRCSASARVRRDRAGRQGRRRRRRRAPRRRCRSGGSWCRRSRAPAVAPGGEDPWRRAGSARPSERARVRMRKSAVLSLSVTVVPASSLGLQPRRDPLGKPPQPQLERAEIGDVVSKVVSAETLLVSRSALTGRSSMPWASRASRSALGAVAAHQLGLAGALQVADRCASPSRASRACVALPTPKISGDRLRRQERRRLRAAEHRKAARLVEVGGDLGEELVDGQPDRHGDADARARPRAAKRASDLRRRSCRAAARCRTRSMNASSIDTGSTSGVSSSISARTSRPTAAYFSMSGCTTLACGQSRRASNIGIAERTPKVRAT